MSEKRVINMRAQDGSVVVIECHDALPSTARLAREYARNGYPDRYVVLSGARQRTDADGKSKSALERGVFMSCILRPSIFPSQAALISALSAVATVTALEEHSSGRMGIGWVSKIYCNGKQIGDVTIEGKLDNFTTYEYIIINYSVLMSEKNFPTRLGDVIKQVFENGGASVSVVVAKNILNKFFTHYANVKTGARFMSAYKQKFILRGQKIKCTIDGKKRRVKVVDVGAEDCSLTVLSSKKQEIKISSPAGVTIPKIVRITK
ncbi:MAG: hypothetical protein J6V09_02865 [Clostridia bacterium]|nr:hypothetical protein [Clostridia bacterium]